VRENAGPTAGKALRVTRLRPVRDEGSQHREGYSEGETPSGSGRRRESLRGPKSPGEARAPAGSNPFGSEKGYGLHGGIKPSKRRLEAVRVSGESAGAERGNRKVLSITVAEENSEGLSP